jgi:hypothetical protein
LLKYKIAKKPAPAGGYSCDYGRCRASPGKTIGTVLVPVAISRAYHHCAACGRGVLPRDGELGVAGLSLSPGLRSMTDRAGAAVPFTPASALLADLGGSASPPGG